MKHRIKLRRPNRTYQKPDSFLLGIMAMTYVVWMAVTLPFMPFTYEGFWLQLGIVLLCGLIGPLIVYAIHGRRR